MLTQELRLRKKADFDTVFKRGRSFATPFFTVRSMTTSLGHPRIGIVVSNKISKLATVRNKIRRRIRESVRSAIAGGASSMDVVIITKPLSVNASFDDIKKTVVFSFEKIGATRGARS